LNGVTIMIRFGWLTDDAPALYPSAGDRLAAASEL
jgi:hypothetical protein